MDRQKIDTKESMEKMSNLTQLRACKALCFEQYEKP